MAHYIEPSPKKFVLFPRRQPPLCFKIQSMEDKPEPVTERESWISLMTFPSVLSIPDCIAMGTIKARGFQFLAGPRLPDGVARDEAQDPVQEAIGVE